VKWDTQELDFLMREIVIDTETTGLDPLDDHRARLDLKAYLQRWRDTFITLPRSRTATIMTISRALGHSKGRRIATWSNGFPSSSKMQTDPTQPLSSASFLAIAVARAFALFRSDTSSPRSSMYTPPSHKT